MCERTSPTGHTGFGSNPRHDKLTTLPKEKNAKGKYVISAYVVTEQRPNRTDKRLGFFFFLKLIKVSNWSPPADLEVSEKTESDVCVGKWPRFAPLRTLAPAPSLPQVYYVTSLRNQSTCRKWGAHCRLLIGGRAGDWSLSLSFFLNCSLSLSVRILFTFLVGNKLFLFLIKLSSKENKMGIFNFILNLNLNFKF